MNTLFQGASGFMINGGTFNATSTTNISQPKKGIDLLIDWIAVDAFHNSDELYDAPKCHPHTRVAVLDDIMKWVMGSEPEVQDDFMMWLFGPAGAGKSAIAKKIAELAAERGLLIGSFFFSKTSSKRNTKDRLIPTLAYQMTLSIPGTRSHVEQAIETDPVIFLKDIQTQIDTLLIKPLQAESMQNTPSSKLFIIDGLDECNHSQVQVTILDAISRSFATHKLSIRCLIVSRLETDIVTSFNGKEPLRSIHRRLALDDTYHPDDDIRRFFSDKFEQIRCTHWLKSTIPTPWPTIETLDALVRKSSGQFIFAATVVRFVESNRHRPAARLNVILGISPPGTINPFTELDACYRQVLSFVDDMQLTLHVLSLYASLPDLAARLGNANLSERFLSLEEGQIAIALIDLSSLVSYDKSSGRVKILHASLVDFLSDKRRSHEFYIDMASARAGFACRTLQFVKGPDGIRAGDVGCFRAGIQWGGWIFNRELKNEMLNFDLDAFLTAAVRSPHSERSDVICKIFILWMVMISSAEEKNRDVKLLIHRCCNSFQSRIQKYQSDYRLQLLLTLTLVPYHFQYSMRREKEVPISTCLDILLEMHDNDLYLVDENALGLRYSEGSFHFLPGTMRRLASRYVDGHRCASAALHCMTFLSNPPKYFETGSNVDSETGVTYAKWKATCEMAIDMLCNCNLLGRANTSPEVIQFISDHDINTTVQKNLSVDDVCQVNMHILAFLSRANACVNWRIISAIQRAGATDTFKSSNMDNIILRWVELLINVIPRNTFRGLTG